MRGNKMKTLTKENENIKKQEVKHTLDKCVSAPHPEMARNNENDEPCDIE